MSLSLSCVSLNTSNHALTGPDKHTKYLLSPSRPHIQLKLQIYADYVRVVRLKCETRRFGQGLLLSSQTSIINISWCTPSKGGRVHYLITSEAHRFHMLCSLVPSLLPEISMLCYHIQVRLANHQHLLYPARLCDSRQYISQYGAFLSIWSILEAKF